jgi:RNA polymerase subunit RPABC4/transcription elongation factor Spt4
VVSAEAVRKNCSFCGALMHERAKTCPACGKQQPS